MICVLALFIHQNVTTDGAMMDMPSGTQNVILYCICTRNDNNNRPIAVGPTTWFINGTAVTRTTASGDNPYYRDNVPSPFNHSNFYCCSFWHIWLWKWRWCQYSWCYH